MILQVYPAALVVFALETVAVEYLNFVSSLQTHAAVAACLSSRVRHERSAEFQMQLDIIELLFSDDRTGSRLKATYIPV